MVADGLELLEPARGGSCPSEQRQGLAATGEDKVPSPSQKSLGTSATTTAQRRKRSYPGLISPRTVWKSHPRRLVAYWLGLVQPVRCETCPAGQCRGPSAPGEDKFLPWGQEPLHTYATPTTLGQKNDSLGP